MTQTRPRKSKARPAQITTAQERGQALRAWLAAEGLKIVDFAEVTTIGRATLNRYLEGLKDLATVEQEIADKLLRALGISDTEAWELLGIPDENRSTFRSFRPPPYGHGGPVRTSRDITLTEPLFGSIALPANSVLRIDEGPAGEQWPLQILQLADGRYFAVTAGMETAGAAVIGGLVSVHFVARPSARLPAEGLRR